MSRKHKKDNQKIFQSYSMILQFGISMIVPIGICVGLGIFIGDKLHASWIVIPFFFIGAVAGATSVYKLSRSIWEEKK